MNDEIRMANDELPETWVECTLGEVTPYGSTKKVEPSEIPLDAWILELEDVEKDTSKIIQRFTFRERKSKSTKNRFEAGDVLYGKLRPYLNKVVLADDGGYCTTEIIPLKSTAAVQSEYLFYWLKHPVFLEYVTEVSHGLSMPRLGTDAGKAAPFVLAPLAEQKRIADKLEAVLGRVDACRARLDRVPALLKRFRQSVLAAATSGKLTEEWREANECVEDAASLLERMDSERRAVHARQGGNRKYREAEPVASEELPEIPVTWRWTNFDHCSSEISVGHVGPMKDRYVDKGIAFLRCQNVRPLRFSPRGLVCIPVGFHKELSKSELHGGEILVVRSGANTGDCCVFPCGFGEANCSDLVITRPLSGLSSEYGAIYVNSPTGQSLLDQKQAGVAQPHFNIGAMRVKAFPLAPFAEQQEIVRRVEDLFAFADRIEARLATAQKTVERLTPATLAKAFRGELVPQDPNDEPASALLERISAMQSNDTIKKTPTKGVRPRRSP